MSPIRLPGVIALCLSMLLSSANAVAAENPKLKIGDPAPDWSELIGTDDKRHALKDLTDKSVVVVCFTCNNCPYAVDYEDRMIAFSQKYADHPKGVTLIAINANNKPKEKLELMKERASEKKFPFAYLQDETQKVADSYGASFTPEFFVLNADRKIVYMGALDDKTDAAQAEVNYVELAVEAALNGNVPDTTEVPARGCAIPFKRARK